MKVIGIIGGATSESTLEYYRYITESYIERFDNYGYPKILINSVSFEEFFQCMKNDNFHKLNSLIASEGKLLENAGADFIIVACNTFHLFLDKLRNEISIPILSIIDSVKAEIEKDKLENVLLLGTKHTMDFNLFGKEYKDTNIDVVVPDKKDKDIINEIVYDELPRGIIKNKSKEKILKIIKKFQEKGTEGIILGCTELPLIIKKEDTPLKIYDTTYIHSIAALKYAIE
ncbi:MAG: aspartate racemase [Kosmotogales bacterium]|nr:aspartate racemase [Kosmotogales bacterium]